VGASPRSTSRCRTGRWGVVTARDPGAG
jgi:hypothetical protein